MMQGWQLAKLYSYILYICLALISLYHREIIEYYQEFSLHEIVGALGDPSPGKIFTNIRSTTLLSCI